MAQSEEEKNKGLLTAMWTITIVSIGSLVAALLLVYFLMEPGLIQTLVAIGVVIVFLIPAYIGLKYLKCPECGKRTWCKKVYVALQVILSLLCALLHATYFKEKYEQIQPYGELVDVFDGKMHITQAGEGETTIVLLPGLGEGLPSADFAPLIRELSKDYRVVCVDYFGVGFSSETSRERTCGNYVEEIREVLKNANIEGPYVLMPHSISSLYCEYYASCYPDEVKAIISLDGSSSAYNEAIPNILKKVMPILYKLQGFCGAEVNTMLTTNKKQWMDEYGYTEKEVDDYIIYQGFAINDNFIETSINTDVLIKDVMALEYPAEVPYYKIISEYTYTHNAGNISGEQYHMEHLERVGAEDSYAILDGTHFIYRNNAEEICRIVKEFLDETKFGT